MIIIYHCYGGAHSSVISAAIHIGMLPDNRIPDYEEIKNLPFYDKTTSKEIGIPFYFGKDKSGNRVYIMGMGSEEKRIKEILCIFLRIEKKDNLKIHLENTLKNVNWIVRIGGFLSRGLGLIFPGRFLTILGLRLNYPKFIETVKRVKT